jgi:hypothetical protein
LVAEKRRTPHDPRLHSLSTHTHVVRTSSGSASTHAYAPRPWAATASVAASVMGDGQKKGLPLEQAAGRRVWGEGELLQAVLAPACVGSCGRRNSSTRTKKTQAPEVSPAQLFSAFFSLCYMASRHGPRPAPRAASSMRPRASPPQTAASHLPPYQLPAPPRHRRRRADAARGAGRLGPAVGGRAAVNLAPDRHRRRVETRNGARRAAPDRCAAVGVPRASVCIRHASSIRRGATWGGDGADVGAKRSRA